MTCPHPEPCANPYVHAEKDCKCSCGKRLATHPPLTAKPRKSWRDEHGTDTNLRRVPKPTRWSLRAA